MTNPSSCMSFSLTQHLVRSHPPASLRAKSLALLLGKRRTSIRKLTTDAQNENAVELDYTAHVPANGNKTDGALVILHGFLGSKRNFASLSKLFMKDLGVPVYALDLRNQGTSPHTRPMNYSAMAGDVLHFIRNRSLNNVSLLGHSMGGKAAMSVALHPSLSEPSNGHILSKLIVADVSPTRAQLSPEFKLYVEAMKKIEEMRLKTRKEALAVLEDYETDGTMRQFLLTNLKPFTSNEPYASFRLPLDILVDAIPDIGYFPYAPGERTWEGSTMFIRGLKSAYITSKSLPTIESFFPNYKLEALDAGHWVHGDRPDEFRQVVVDFVKS